MTYAAFRSSPKRWTSRPPANCRSARDAWDWFAKQKQPACVWLADGYWMCEFTDGTNDDFEHTVRDERPWEKTLEEWRARGTSA